MRSFFIAAAALFAIAVPGLAMADTGGSLGLTYASIDDEGDGNKENVLGLSGGVVTDLHYSGWRLQFNAAAADLDHSVHSDGFTQAEVHATYDAGQFQIGGFAGMFDNIGSSYYEYGAEGAVNFDSGRIAVSVAGADSVNSSDLDTITTVAAEGTFNLNDNWSVGASASNSDFGNFFTTDEVSSWGVHVAYNIPNSDFTVAVGYRSADADDDVEFIGVSLGWRFGEGGARMMPGADALIPDAIAAL